MKINKIKLLLFLTVSIVSLLLAKPSPVNAQATLAASPVGSSVTFSWGEIVGYPIGMAYSLGAWSGTLSCDATTLLTRARDFQRDYTYDGSGRFETWWSTPAGSYTAALYTFGGLLSNCDTFTVEAGFGPGIIRLPGNLVVPAPPGVSLPTWGLGKIISEILPYILIIAGIITFIWLIVAGFRYIFSAGDPKAAESARNNITFALIGFAIIFGAWWLTLIVQRALGLCIVGPC